MAGPVILLCCRNENRFSIFLSQVLEIHNILIFGSSKISFFFREIIRRKAVQALYKFYLIAPNQVQHIHDKFRKALCDRDVGVMAASLHIYLEMIKVGKESSLGATCIFYFKHTVYCSFVAKYYS